MINSMTDLPAVAGYLTRIGAEPRSLRIAVVKEQHGKYWTDLATIHLNNKTGEVSAPDEYAPTEAEAMDIKREVTAAEWPTPVVLPGKTFGLPGPLKDSDPDDIYILRDKRGDMVMLQHRMLTEDGDKRYVPWTFWSDQQWRPMEPEGKLPLFGLETLKDHATVFIHEGAKAARAIQRLIEPRTVEEHAALAAHPWGTELQGAAHLGWIGGALSPGRTDWSLLAETGVKRAYIVADNDQPGKSSVAKISQNLKGISVFSIEFNDTFPTSFDLGDEFPKKMFKKIGKATHYTGPAFRDLLHPATWATDVVKQKVGKALVTIRKEFSDMWVWIEETDTFVNKEMPHINHSLGIFNSMVSAFSNVAGTGQLLQKNYKGRTAKVAYRPDIPARMVTDRTTSAINLHTPSTIRAVPGDDAPWIEFLDYLFPVERERKEVMKWCATLIAKPEVRMLYSMLLVSERQGMGKSTLGERILAPLVGLQNTGFPGERDMVESSFNGWAANKRLVVVGEIYTGQSFKAYNILKSYITDKNINVNEKFQRPYTIDNWVHIVACSNSKKALRIEDTDRRWFYPQVSETAWKREQWGRFYDWLNSGGLGIIRHWAENYGEYVASGEHAPMTVSKKHLIQESKGEAVNAWHDILEGVESDDTKVAFYMNDVLEFMKKRHGKIYENVKSFRKEAAHRGWGDGEQLRLKVEKLLTYVVVSPALWADVKEAFEEDVAEEDRKTALKTIREYLLKVHDHLSEFTENRS